MKTFLAAALAALMLSPAAFGAGKTLTPQQLKMKDCNAQAKAQALKGKARQSFLSQCLSSGAPKVTKAKTAKPLTAQQKKMQTCNASATEQHLKGTARKAFMSSCLKK